MSVLLVPVSLLISTNVFHLCIFFVEILHSVPTHWLNLLRSKVIQNSPNPGWNESWRIKNVPATATLHVTVMDKDEVAVMDDRTGEFNTTVNVGVKEVEIVGPFHQDRGTFWLKVQA